MRRILFLIILIGGILHGCRASGGYTINGTVEGIEVGKVFILKQKFTKENWDALAIGTVKDGKFVIKGKVQEPTAGYVVMEGMMGAIVFLENDAKYDIHMASREVPVVTGGGQEQKIYQGYVDISTRMTEEYHKFSPDMIKALQENNEERKREFEERMGKMRDAFEKEQVAYLKQHGNSFFALFKLATRALGMDVASVKKDFDLCSEELKKTEPGQYISSLLPRLAKIAIGATAPDFTAKTPDGDDVSLYGTKGKVKLLDFWSSNCGKCREEIRKFIPIYNEYKLQGFEILALSLDKDREAWVKAIKEDGAPWVQVSDLKGSKSPLNEIYGIWTLPSNLLLDENNKVLARNISSEQLKEMLPEYLNLKQ